MDDATADEVTLEQAVELSPGTTPARPRSARRHLAELKGLRRVLLLLGGLGAVAFVVPGVAGVAWSAVAAVLGSLPGRTVVGLVVLWGCGLAAHTITLTGALPRLSHRRALTLSLTGSAVANVLPMGGAAGVATNYTMTRSWGFTGREFAAYTVVSNLWDVLAKLVLAALVLPWVVLTGSLALGHLVGVALGVGAVALSAVVVVLVALLSPRASRAIGRGIDAAVRPLARFPRLHLDRAPGTRTVEVLDRCRDVVGRGWARLSLGMALYTALLLALLGACLSVTGAQVTVPGLLAAFTVERLLSMAGVTPGGVGVVEVGLTGVLVLAGASPAGAVAGVLLYRALTFGLEIPVGGSHLVLWLWLERRRRAAGAVVPGVLERAA